MSQILVTSKKSSEILNVHESSVKRRCNLVELEAIVSNGGHRRINLDQTIKVAELKNNA